ncbi:MAG: hypothetical protein AAF525_04375 [Pseudomonadota bacterium]
MIDQHRCTRKVVVILIALVCLISAPVGWSADKKTIEQLKPEGIIEVSVDIEAEMATLRGKAKDLQAISRYMRVLDDKVGSPDLENITRKGDVSEFVILVKLHKR